MDQQESPLGGLPFIFKVIFYDRACKVLCELVYLEEIRVLIQVNDETCKDCVS